MPMPPSTMRLPEQHEQDIRGFGVTGLSPWRDLRWGRGEFRRLLGQCDAHGMRRLGRGIDHDLVETIVAIGEHAAAFERRAAIPTAKSTVRRWPWTGASMPRESGFRTCGATELASGGSGGLRSLRRGRSRRSGLAGDARVAFIIAIPNLERGAAGTELLSNVTLTEEGSGRFFSTPNLDTCFTVVAANEPLEDEPGTHNVVGKRKPDACIMAGQNRP